MRSRKQKKKELSEEQLEIIDTKDFFDRIAPGIMRFYTDHYICGNFYKSCWAVTEYPPSTEETAILAHLADRNGVTLRIYNRLVTSMEQRKIVQQAMRKNHMMTTTNDVNESIKAQNNIDDVVELLSELRRNKEPLLHTAVFIELKASTEDKLKELQADIQMELTRSKISVDRLLLRQKRGSCLFILRAITCLQVNLNVFFLQVLWLIFIPSTIRARPMRAAFMLEEISTARIFLLTLISVQRIRQTAISLSSATAVRANLIL